MENQCKITCPKCKEKITITVTMAMYGGGGGGGTIRYDPPTLTYEVPPYLKDQEQ